MGGAVDEGAVHGICWSIGRFQEVSENAGGNKSSIANYTNYARKLSRIRGQVIEPFYIGIRP